MKECRESKLSEPVSNWLKQQGYEVYAEVPFQNRNVDIVGEKNKQQIAIELKLYLTKKLVQQALSLQLATPLVYCAIASEPRMAGIEKCKELGLGILQIISGKVIVLLEPQDEKWSSPHWKFKLDRHPKGGIGGLPVLEGFGPAQETRKRVQKYRKDHPKATWKELYENVPNHYASHASMANAQRMLEEYLRWKQQMKEEEKKK